MVNLLHTKNNPVEQVLDFYTWLWLQGWFMPYYVIGKQDEWKDWVGSTLNGWRVSNLCKP